MTRSRTATSAAPYVPEHAGLDELREAANACRGCDLYRNATQAVVSSGPADARVVLVGEQPGDVEDRRGEPFVGPAGGVLARALSEIGIPPEQAYLTNAVKHFKFYTRADLRNGACTTRPTAPRSSPAGPGCAPSSRCCVRRSWSPSAPPRRRRWPGPPSG